MLVRLHPHARERIAERVTSIDEVVATISRGESISAPLRPIGFPSQLPVRWDVARTRLRHEAGRGLCGRENGAWLVITVIVRYF
jgi:hypothetical protein